MSALTTPASNQQSQMDVRSSSGGSIATSWKTCLPATANAANIQDISDEAVWSLSSCKECLGVHQLLDDRPDTYWQSDGLQPHTITIEFQRKTDISFIVIYLDYKSDESYTPNKIQVQTGSSVLDLDEPKTVTFNEPTGWQVVDLRQYDKRAVRAFVIQIQVLQNHQNGRDTHIRGMRVLGPANSGTNLIKRALTRENEQIGVHFDDQEFVKSVFGCRIR